MPHNDDWTIDVLARIIGLLRVHALNSRLRYSYFYSLVAVPACYKLGVRILFEEQFFYSKF